MLFIPIDVLNMKPKFHQTSGLNHVAWFILHCLVFREQSLVLSNRAAHLSDLFIVSHRFLSVKDFFEFLFKNFLAKSASNLSQLLATQGLLVVFRCRISQRLVLWYTSFPHMSTPFSKKIADLAKNLNFLISVMSAKQKKRTANAIRFVYNWWRQRDLNSWHCGYEPHALANWAMPPKVVGRDGFEPS